MVILLSENNQSWRKMVMLLSDYHIGRTCNISGISTAVDVASDIDADDGDGLRRFFN